jgi:hypothetical protein
LPFRYRGSRRESAVAQLFSLGSIRAMTNQPYFSRFTWFFIGLAAGLVAMFMYQLGVRAQYAREDSDTGLDYYLWSKAQYASATESSPVIMYAWSAYLENNERLRGRSHAFFVTRESPSVMLDAHGWLAKLYAESGDTNSSTEHLDLALRFAQSTRLNQTVTNKETLWKYLDSQRRTDR